MILSAGIGVILPSGEIRKDKINLVAGAITQPFVEMVILVTMHCRQLKAKRLF